MNSEVLLQAVFINLDNTVEVRSITEKGRTGTHYILYPNRIYVKRPAIVKDDVVLLHFIEQEV